MSEPMPGALDPRVDHSAEKRPAVLGGECSSCLHRPPLHEIGCAQLPCRAPAPCACSRCALKAAWAARDKAEQVLEDQDVDGCHHALTMAGVSAGALFERVEDVISDLDDAQAEVKRLRELAEEALGYIADLAVVQTLRSKVGAS
jgi:hypothetical protein